jgi:hypothetical protein
MVAQRPHMYSHSGSFLKCTYVCKANNNKQVHVAVAFFILYQHTLVIISTY